MHKWLSWYWLVVREKGKKMHLKWKNVSLKKKNGSYNMNFEHATFTVPLPFSLSLFADNPHYHPPPPAAFLSLLLLSDFIAIP